MAILQSDRWRNYAFAWGAYHTSWNPPGSVLEDDVTDRYIAAIRAVADGCIVWGPRIDNVKLLTRFVAAISPSVKRA